MILPIGLFAACVATSDVTPLLPSDDCGPRPDNYRAIAAAWLNAHCRYSPPNPIKPEELSMTAPVRVATVDEMHGRNVGWRVILGPENKVVCNFADAKYTRMIINRGRVISVTSDNRLAALLPTPPSKVKAKR
ncbi:hypothetical protein CfE428DRAFT_4352 [Chthoniobacter flavus Ellin428]|uniref:Uncharacterized protein n=2 Tax=Chthoniobacter flavus TaxID=191863 RepID=B4D613_9BACT|nr:hypothetical protein CfE428DRAFT_4352 [Chthoniobacter flavus Ellin428]